MVDGEKVRMLPGVSRPDLASDSQPVPEVVQFIEGLLARAKAGEIQAIAIAYSAPGNITGDGWAVGTGCSHDIMASISDLFYRACLRRWENQEPDSRPPGKA